MQLDEVSKWTESCIHHLVQRIEITSTQNPPPTGNHILTSHIIDEFGLFLNFIERESHSTWSFLFDFSNFALYWRNSYMIGIADHSFSLLNSSPLYAYTIEPFYHWWTFGFSSLRLLWTVLLCTCSYRSLVYIWKHFYLDVPRSGLFGSLFYVSVYQQPLNSVLLSYTPNSGIWAFLLLHIFSHSWYFNFSCAGGIELICKF